jgi:DNA-binding response OmpR family regulator
MRNRMLVLSADPQLRGRLARTFRSTDFEVLERDSVGPAGAFPLLDPDLVVFDIADNEARGIGDIRELHLALGVPLMVLRSSSTADGEVMCFNAGALEVAHRTAPPAVLIARARALVPNNICSPLKGAVSVGPLHLDRDTRRVECGHQLVDLNRTEFALLEILMRRPQHVIERDALIRAAWDVRCSDRALESSLSRLRMKIRNAGGPPIAIPMRGVGYRLGLG